MRYDVFKYISVVVFCVAGFLAFFVGNLFYNAHFVFAETATVTVEVVWYECGDGVDNDFDGLTDYPNDPGCDSASDDDETNPQCNDTLDNDADGFVDFPDDVGCSDVDDDDETNPQCNDGVDNDGDGFVDYPDDLGCGSVTDNDESGSGTTENTSGSTSGGSTSSSADDPSSVRVDFVGLGHLGGNVFLLRDGVIAGEVPTEDDGTFGLSLFGVTPGTYVFTLYGVDANNVRSGLLSFTTEIVPSGSVLISDMFLPPTLLLTPDGSGYIAKGNVFPASSVMIDISYSGQNSNQVTATADAGGHFTQRLGLDLVQNGSVVAARGAISGLISPFGNSVRITSNLFKQGRITGDINGDDRVNIVDFSIALFWYERDNPPRQLDVNEDGQVDLADISIMAFFWTG